MSLNVAKNFEIEKKKRRKGNDDDDKEEVLTAEEQERMKMYMSIGATLNEQNLKEEDEDAAATVLAVDDRTLTAKEKLGRSHQQRAIMRRKRNRSTDARLNVQDKKRERAANELLQAEILQEFQPGTLEAESELEHTANLTQAKLKHMLPEQAAQNIFDLNLNDSYTVRYDRSGRYSCLLGSKGHVAMMDALNRSLVHEMHLSETVRDCTFLHDHALLAIAQKQHLYIYNEHGAEVHCLSKHTDIHALTFLPHHWLLASIGRAGYLKYHDTSTGTFVSDHRTKLGPCSLMRHNPWNAVVHCGHQNGTVTLWSPAQSTFLAKMLCHRGPVQGMAITQDGQHMVTAGADKLVKVWDLRMFKELHRYYSSTSISDLDVSQSGIIGISHGPHSTFWKGAIKTRAEGPYMRHLVPSCETNSIRFRPYEDVCMVGHNHGVSSIVIPGSGEANYDSFEANPYQTTKQRNEATVRSLLDKLQPEMISLDPSFLGNVDREHTELVKERKDISAKANGKERNRKRGKNKIGKKLARKNKNIVDSNTEKFKEMMKAKEKEEKDVEVNEKLEKTPLALQRFVRR